MAASGNGGGGNVTIISLDKVAQYLQKPIKNLPDVEVARTSIAQAPSLPLAGVPLSLKADAVFDIAAFNDPGDQDPDGVVTDLVAYPGGQQRGWLRYRIAGSLTADSELKLNSAKVGIDASASIAFSDYRLHPLNRPAHEAVRNDLSSPRTILDKGSVENVGIDEALLMRVRGDLEASIELTWSDVWSKALGTIVAALDTRTPLVVEAKAAASVGFQVTLTDDFLLALTKVDDATYRVAVRKTSGNGVVIKEDVGIVAGFSKPDAAKAEIRRLIAGIAGESLSTVDAALAAAAGETLTDKQEKIIEKLAKLLKIDDEIEGFQKRAEAIRKKIGSVVETIESAATTRVALSFAHEYSRLSTSQLLIRARVPKDTLLNLHGDLVQRRFRKLIDAPNVTLEKYLDEEKTKRTRAWGFTLGIGKFQVVEKDSDEMETVIRRSSDGHGLMIAYAGRRAFGATKWADIAESVVDFKAEMPSYDDAPTAADFDFGLQIGLELTRRKLNRESIGAIVDAARVWRIVDGAGAADLQARLEQRKGTNATAAFELVLDEPALLAVMPLCGAARLEDAATALAAAVPFQDGYDARRNVGLRIRAYAPMWLRVLRGETANWAHEASRAVRDIANDGLVNVELQNHLWTFANLVNGHPHAQRVWRGFATGAQMLGEAVTVGTMKYWKIPTIYQQMRGFWTQALYMRAVGALITDVAERNGALDAVTRVARITAGDEEIVAGA